MNQKIESFKNDVNDIKIPEQKLDIVIQQAILRKNKRKKRNLISGSVACACVAGLVFSASYSPTFAAYAQDIPVLNTIINTIHGDKGLYEAAENGFNQEVNHTASDKGIDFTIDQVIADQKRMIILFSVQTSKYPDVKELTMNNMKITDEKGKEIYAIKNGKTELGHFDNILPLWTHHPGEIESSSEKDKGKLLGFIELVNQKTDAKVPKKLNFNISEFVEPSESVELSKREPIKIAGNWKVGFDLSKNTQKAISPLVEDKQFDLAIAKRNLQINIDHVIAYPTMTEVKMSLLNSDVLGSNGILYTYHLEDESGNRFIQIGDGILSDTGNVMPQFETTYFKKPKNLYLVITEAMLTGKTEEESTTVKMNDKIKLY